MKVLMLNGSPRENGNIALAFSEMEQVFKDAGVEVENILLGRMDDEGRQVMRVLARNMVFLMKSIALGKKEVGLPEEENRVWTNFTR